MAVKVPNENQLGTLAREGRLAEIPGYDPSEARERLDRAEPFMDTLAAGIEGGRKGGQEDRQRDQQVRSVLRQISLTGVVDITVVNCMTWPVEITCGVHRHMVKRADPKKGEIFHARTFGWKDVRIDCGDLGDGKNQVSALLPVEIGLEFKRKYVGVEGELDTDDDGKPIVNKPGGLFVYAGTEANPPKDFGEQLAAAQERMGRYFWAQYEAGKANWQRFKQDPLYITERMKDAANYLYSAGRLPALPEWIAADKQQSNVKECPNCGEQVRRVAKQCRHCFAVLHDDGGFTRQGGQVTKPSPDPEPPPTPKPQPRSSAPAESASNIELSDLDVLNTEDPSKLPELKPARPGKAARGNKSVGNEEGN